MVNQAGLSKPFWGSGKTRQRWVLGRQRRGAPGTFRIAGNAGTVLFPRLEGKEWRHGGARSPSRVPTQGQGGNASSHDSEAPQSRCLVEVPHCCTARAGSAPWDPWERGEGGMQSPPGTGTGAGCPLGSADGFMEHLEPPVPRCTPLVPPLRGVWGGTSCSCPEKGLCCFQGKSEDRAEGRSPRAAPQRPWGPGQWQGLNLQLRLLTAAPGVSREFLSSFSLPSGPCLDVAMGDAPGVCLGVAVPPEGHAEGRALAARFLLRLICVPNSCEELGAWGSTQSCQNAQGAASHPPGCSVIAVSSLKNRENKGKGRQESSRARDTWVPGKRSTPNCCHGFGVTRGASAPAPHLSFVYCAFPESQTRLKGSAKCCL